MSISVSAHAVIKEDDQVLLIKRSDTGFWAIPGGRIQKNETFDQAVFREIREECGIRIELLGVCGLFSNPVWKEGIHSIVYLARPKEKLKHRQTKEAKEIKYFNLSELPKELLRWHLEYIQCALSGFVIREKVFKVKSPEDILNKPVGYDIDLSVTDYNRLKKIYLSRN